MVIGRWKTNRLAMHASSPAGHSRRRRIRAVVRRSSCRRSSITRPGGRWNAYRPRPAYGEYVRITDSFTLAGRLRGAGEPSAGSACSSPPTGPAARATKPSRPPRPPSMRWCAACQPLTREHAGFASRGQSLDAICLCPGDKAPASGTLGGGSVRSQTGELSHPAAHATSKRLRTAGRCDGRCSSVRMRTPSSSRGPRRAQPLMPQRACRCSSRRGMISTKLQGRWRLSSCHLRISFQASLQAPGEPGRQKM